MTRRDWFKSSYSGTQGDSCVEIAITAQAVHIRDSKVAEGPVLLVRPGNWARFLHGAEGLDHG
ncbi:DUF397 domain-containing protein [Yinghuangia soli]|uniref:DUF397 domain-containing protein n=1 Tax=Yinghuangia soli TaxID=2908204 RepID=A0AA41PUJ2_9ACTN|nr:DUF397 domain-containing protein [Yinghuangia soli]MCF2526120.1 DUF397 domain-containing protein [Yinghuangia soli]